jgi:serine/threonine-protein kinase
VAQVNVPNLVGLTEAQAVDKLKDANLAPGEKESVASSDEDKGKVVDQNPSEGTLEQEGTKVNIKIGLGVTQVQVPVLQGMTEDAATKTLGDAGLKMKKATAVSEEAFRDRVVDQDPGEGENVKPGSTVTVTFGTGPEMVTIPDGIVGMQLDAAKQSLKDAGLNSTDQSTASDQPKEQVLSMTRFDNGQPAQPGDKVQKGFTVNLTWSDFSQFQLPNITQLSPEAATKSLKSAGWNGDTSTLQSGEKQVETSEPSQVGLILGQDPAAGTVVGKNAKITITVGVLKKIFVPNLVGMTYDQALGTLQGLGWRGELQRAGTTPNPPKGLGNTISQQSPGPQAEITILDNVAVNIYAPEPPPTTKTTPTSTGGAPTTGQTNPPATTGRRRGRGGGTEGPGNGQGGPGEG